MKKLAIILCILFSSSLAFGHCGSCGVGGDDHSEKKAYKKWDSKLSKLNLEKKTEKKVRSLLKKQKKEKEGLRKKHKKQLSKLLTAEQMDTLYKKSCSECENKTCADKKKCESCEKKDDCETCKDK